MWLIVAGTAAQCEATGEAFASAGFRPPVELTLASKLVGEGVVVSASQDAKVVISAQERETTTEELGGGSMVGLADRCGFQVN